MRRDKTYPAAESVRSVVTGGSQRPRWHMYVPRGTTTGDGRDVVALSALRPDTLKIATNPPLSCPTEMDRLSLLSSSLALPPHCQQRSFIFYSTSRPFSRGSPPFSSPFVPATPFNGTELSPPPPLPLTPPPPPSLPPVFLRSSAAIAAEAFAISPLASGVTNESLLFSQSVISPPAASLPPAATR